MMRNGKKAPVISDVAACAGVSVSTVSRYLNGSSHLSVQAADKIARAIELLGYRPSSVARGLKKASLDLLAVFSSNTTLLGSAVTIQGIEDEARQRGYAVMISKLDSAHTESLTKVVDAVTDLNPSGIVLLKYDEVSERVRTLLPHHIPVVVIGGSREDDCDQVSLCERDGGRAVTNYLLDLGHQTVHHIGVPARSWGTSRTDGWHEALSARGIVAPEGLYCGWEAQSARRLGRNLGKDPQVTAVFAGNDELAMGFMRGVREVGRRVPEDISVVGFDDHPLAEVWEPSITTYRQDFTSAGREAVRLVIRRIEAEQGNEIAPRLSEIHGDIVERQSAAAPRLSQ